MTGSNNKNNMKRKSRKQRKSRSANNRLPDTIRELTRVPQVREQALNLVRTTNYTISWSGNLGWSATGFFDLAFAFSMNSVDIYSNGALLTSVAYPGIADLSNLFEWWRLNKVEVQMFSSSNSLAQTTGGNVAALPVLNIAFDPNDISAISLNSILQYENLRTVQIGNGRYVDGFVFECRPSPALLAQVPVGSGRLEPQRSNPFISTDTGAVTCYGVKMVLDPGLAAVATNSGAYTFYFRSHFTVKDTK